MSDVVVLRETVSADALVIASGPPGPAGPDTADALAAFAAPSGSTLIMHKSAAGGTTYARTLRQWGVVGGLSDDNVFNWIDSDLDASILDGTIADDVVAMVMAAINEKSVLGGVVDMPQGTFLVGAYQGGGTVITVPSNVRLKGRGASSIIRLKTGTNFNLVNVAANAENVEIDHLLLDGNCASDVNNNAGSTLRSAGCLNTWLHHLYIRNSAAYGIGLETGSQIRLTIDHIDIDGTMADGIDMKNPNNANKGVSISNVNIRNYALNPEETVQTGIDCRGPVKLMNIFIELPGKSDAVGIRFRQGEAGDPTTYPWGIGGHNSTLDNFYIDMGGGANTFGVNAVARGVTISNGKVFRARRGVFAEDSGFSASQVYAFNCSEYGILLDALDGTFDADDSILTACAAYDTVGTGISVEADRCQINACYGEGNSVADVAIASTADQTVINGGSFRSTTKFTLNGTNTRIEDVAGYQQSFTVAQLTTKLTGVVAGRRAFVTDLASTTYGGTATGGGSGKAWCTYDGSAWKVG